MLVAVGSIHGNEPAGALALETVVARIERERLLRRGDFVALVGNVAAFDARARFIDEDLNRHWSGEKLERLLRAEGLERSEDRERKALFEEIGQAFAEARGEVVLLDLHTTSGEGKPFAVFADTMRSRSFARRFPVPAVLGFEEQLEGALVDYVGLLGHVAVAFEGGQHLDPASVRNLAAVVWVALGQLRMVTPLEAGLEAETRRLARSTEGVPSILEVTYRHAITERDGFSMRPGHRSFEPVSQGQMIADDRQGPVAAPSDGFLLMPLYQKLGDDGFFVVRKVREFWLVLSAIFRYLRLGRIAHWLPGVSRADDPGSLRVDRRVARWYSLEILHLLGYRRKAQEGEVLIVERRAHDVA
jgi:succinylglutamate desuccinylase